MKLIKTEKFIEKLDCKIYPITFIKFLLNKSKILSYFSKAASEDFHIRGLKYEIDHRNCPVCAEKKDMLCRQHTSIQRVLNTDKVAFDLDTNAFFYKNEIFRMVGNKLVIIYCPHPKLIVGKITDEKVRKIIPITIEDSNLESLPKYKDIRRFLSTELLDQNMKCWFNSEFDLVTLPKDRNNSNFCLIPNN
jgi:hypothetical protein